MINTKRHKSYYDWLKSQIEYYQERGKHEFLFKSLCENSFYPVIDLDSNREIEGLNLRSEYTDVYGQNESVFSGDCTFLEFLIALARRMSFIYSRVDENKVSACFWMMIENMFPYQYDTRDESYMHNDGEMYTKAAIHNVIEREYDCTGLGGLFPLKNPREDQRNVEIWYQMNQYLNELLIEEGRM